VSPRFMFTAALALPLFLLPYGARPAMADAPELSLPAGMATANNHLHRALEVIQNNPEEVSDSCVEALKELHETQSKLAAEQEHSNDQDLGVAQDVLESNYEYSLEMCSADAHRMCEAEQQSPGLTKACAAYNAADDAPSSAP
jgi:hypothetical protein